MACTLYIKIPFTLAIPAIAYAGDSLVNLFQENLLIKALSDNVTHGVIGALTWMIFNISKSHRSEFLAETVLCFLLASFIDVDHFVQAKSFRLQNLKDMSGRPLFHCTSLMMLVAIIICLTSHIVSSRLMNLISWSLMIAVLSHHTRDATRRGFWLYPFGATPLLPYWLYLMTLMALPYVLDIARHYTTQDLHNADHSMLAKKRSGLMHWV